MIATAGDHRSEERVDETQASRRRRRALGSWVLVGAVLAGVVAVLLDSRAQADEPDAATLAHGAELYAASCAACHGAAGEGGPEHLVDELGEDIAGPPLRGVDVMLVDQMLRTGRMPIVDRAAGVGSPEQFDDEQREATVAWMTERLELTGELPDVPEGDPVAGKELYAINCASCHGSTGAGGISGDGTLVLGLHGLDRIATFEAIRAGPVGMPRFEEATLSDEEAADIATYVEAELAEPEGTPLGIAEMSRPLKWLLSAVLLAVTMAIVRLVGLGPRIMRRSVEAPADVTSQKGA